MLILVIKHTQIKIIDSKCEDLSLLVQYPLWIPLVVFLLFLQVRAAQGNFLFEKKTRIYSMSYAMLQSKDVMANEIALGENINKIE